MGSIARHIDDMVKEHGTLEKYLESLTVKEEMMDPKIKELQTSIQSIYKAPDDNLGWSFDYGFIKSVSDKSEEIGEPASMEQVDCMLLSILNITDKR